MRDATYVLPLRWQDTTGSAEMTEYLRWLSGYLDIVVVDGSPSLIYEHHSGLWSAYVKHIPPDPLLTFMNGKVNGVTTGIRYAETDAIVVADDDIRLDGSSIERMIGALRDHDVVIAQSFFDPTPWHAQWDEARILLNRAFGVHFPAVLGLRRSLFLEIGGYDGDVLFENLELIRSMRFGGARIARPNDLFVRHLAPERHAFWSQRVRQAYDDFTLPVRMGFWLSLLPMTLIAWRRRHFGSILAAGVGVTVVAEIGRRRGGGNHVYPATASLFAPLWLAERALCSWGAVWYRVIKGGVPYRDGVIERAATPPKELRRRIQERVRRVPER
jgi:hypothetical protein